MTNGLYVVMGIEMAFEQAQLESMEVTEPFFQLLVTLITIFLIEVAI
jgi:hypothetical protein